MKLTTQQKQVLKRMEKGDNMFITGNAGSGKSTVLKEFLSNTERECVVLAPTGVAAMNVGGATIHSFFKFGFGFLGNAQPHKLKTAKGIKYLDTIIIDEISMVRSDIFDMIDRTLRLNTGKNIPFGGIQMILFGDLHQLPPVVHQEEKHLFLEHFGGTYFFHTAGYRSGNFSILQLATIFRQKDPEFINILNAIRSKSLSPLQMQTLNKRVDIQPPLAASGTIVLTARNQDADLLNQRNLINLSGKTSVYRGTINGDFNVNDLPTPIELVLKPGSQIMFVKNDLSEDKLWVNGTIGEVVECKSKGVVVRIGAQEIEVGPEKWEQQRYEFDGVLNEWKTVVIGSYEQLPIRLAWAITIHKSQGKTFDSVYIDLGVRAFAHGQTYVALSRCTSLEGISMKRPVTFRDIIIDEEVLNFHIQSEE